MAAPNPGLRLSMQSPNPSASALDVAHGSAPLTPMRLLGMCLWAVPAFPLKGASGKLRPCGTGQVTARKGRGRCSLGAGSSDRQSGC